MRLPNIDRIATLYLFYPFIKRFQSQNKLRIPILMYHSISENKSNFSYSYYDTNTSPRVFNEQMKFLAENDYRIISINDLIELINLSRPHNRQKYAVITFDDGFRDFYTEAFPILQRYGSSATVFLPTAFIGKKRRVFKDKECMNWDEVIFLNKQGIMFGSHTVTHPQLKYLKNDEVDNEIKRSKEIIEDNIGKRVDYFSYPYAFPDEDKDFVEYLKNVLRKWEYRVAVSTKIGTATNQDDSFFLKRIPVNNYDDPALFQAKVEGGYDWVYKPQYICKIMKAKVI